MEEDLELAHQLQKQLNNQQEESSSSRLSAAYGETMAPKDSPAIPSKYSNDPRDIKEIQPSYGSTYKSAADRSDTSYIAQDMYSKAKGISSDQYFGTHDLEEREQIEKARQKLQTFGSNTKSIGSDMFRDDDQEERTNRHTSGGKLGTDVSSFASQLAARAADGIGAAASGASSLKTKASSFLENLQYRYT